MTIDAEKTIDAVSNLLALLGCREELWQVLDGNISPEISSTLADRLAEEDANINDALTALRHANVRKSIIDAFIAEHQARQLTQFAPPSATHQAHCAVQ